MTREPDSGDEGKVEGGEQVGVGEAGDGGDRVAGDGEDHDPVAAAATVVVGEVGGQCGVARLMPAPFVWFDVTVGDGGDQVRGFYEELFGWTVGPGVGDYQGWITDDSGRPWAGISPAGPAPAGRWLPYVVVTDLDAAATQAVELGGSVVRDKTIGPAGTSVTIADPGGALVALFTPAAAG